MTSKRQPANDQPWLFGNVAVALELVTLEQLQEAVDAQEQLHASGVHTLIGDVMQDLELIDADQCARALVEQDRLLRAAGLRGADRSPPHIGWLIAAFTPALAALPFEAALAWAGALLVGLAVAQAQPLRWVALGWITSTLVPGPHLAAVAASGSLQERTHTVLMTVILGVALAWLPLPGTLRQAGPLLLLGGLLLLLMPRSR
jgi:hypothetical protein